MKKIHSLLMIGAVVALVAVATAPIPAQAVNGVPVDVSLTMPGGATNVGTNVTLAASNYYSNGISQSARSTLQPIVVQYAITGALAEPATLSFRRATGGPVYYTVPIATNALAGVAYVTNTFYWLKGDQIHATLSCTNSGTVIPTCLED